VRTIEDHRAPVDDAPLETARQSACCQRAEGLAAAARSTGLQAVSVPDPSAALDWGLAGSQASTPVVVSGSFHLLAAVERRPPPGSRPRSRHPTINSAEPSAPHTHW